MGEAESEANTRTTGLKLVPPAPDVQQEYLEMITEWQASGEKMIPWVLNEDPSDFDAMIAKLENQSQGKGLKEGLVPATTYWLARNDGKILGATNIRHYLNEFLERTGGHIGMGIRPSERRKGYGTELLRMALKITRDMGITSVLVTCDKDNIASARTIQKNGGVLDSEEEEEDGVIVQRYWIQI
ncbi:MAG TPA: GNAT family N-acetyltransferase [Candidatus Lokiarchaeia archaeon]|nr:GNAT family N-acetyltransferase [Candidatus Lokiarchaeia archaeon]